MGDLVKERMVGTTGFPDRIDLAIARVGLAGKCTVSVIASLDPALIEDRPGYAASWRRRTIAKALPAERRHA